MPIVSKLPEVGTTIFSVMSAMAARHNAVNLSQGFPDFDVHPELIDLVSQAMREGHNQYAPMPGVVALREQIAQKVADLYGIDYDPETEITITSGATEAVFAAITAVVGRDEEAIIVEPAYDAYAPAIRLAGGVPKFVKLSYPGYGIDWDAVRDAISPRTRLLILNTPHNPTGTVMGRSDIDALRAVSAHHEFFILSDEVYEHIIFDSLAHESMVRYPDLAARSFVVSSFGKTYHATGWKIGYCLAPKPLSAELRKIHQYLVFASSTPVQTALATFMAKSRDHLTLGSFYQAKRDLFLELIRPSRFRPLACHGTYFIMLDYSDITDEPDTRFAIRMTESFGVAAIPPSVFYHGNDDHRVLRFCFAKADDTLKLAAERLCRI